MRRLRAEDLDMYVKHYYNYLAEIERLKSKSEVLEAELTRSGGSIVKVAKGPISSSSKESRVSKLRSRYADILADIDSLKHRRGEVDKFMVWALVHPDNKERSYYKIIMYRTMGYGWIDIGDFVNYSHTGARKAYERLILDYLHEKSFN